MRELSILIPTFNDPCSTLVRNLHQQAEALGMTYEILVADDGSTQEKVLEENRSINALPHCQLIERGVNAGRASIRNFLAQQARYAWLLFIDSDMVVCRNDYLRKYASCEETPIVDGGVVIGACKPGNLRSLYEKAAESQHTPEERQLSPYRDFHTANFMIKRTLMLQELGGKYEPTYVVTALGNLATLQFNEGDIVIATLRFQSREFNGQSFMDVVAMEIIKH